MRARSMTSTVLGTSEIARSVRVAVTTTRSNSVASASAGAASAAEDSPWARAMPGSARHSANDNRLGRMEGLDENGDSRRAGVRGCRWRAAWKGKWVPGAWPEARGRTAPGPTWSGSACRCGYAAADSTRCRGGTAVRAGDRKSVVEGKGGYVRVD